MKTPITRRAWAALLPALVVALTACGVSDDLNTQPRSESKDFGYHGGQLTVVTDHDVTLLPDDGRSVTAERQLGGRAARDDNSSWALSDGTLTLSTRCSGLVVSCTARYTVHVPRGTAVTVRGSGTAGITARGGLGALDVTTGQGSVSVDGAGAPLKVRTDTGRIEARGLSAATADVATGHGSVRIGFDAAPADVRAESDTGSVTVEVPPDDTRYRVLATSRTSRPSIAVAEADDADGSGEAAHRITATSKVGSVRIRAHGPHDQHDAKD